MTPENLTNNFELEVAQKVILPKLKKIAQDNPDLTGVSQMRKLFNEVYESSISASKFQTWIDLLDIKFEKKVVIVWPSPPGPGGPGVVVPQDLEEEVDDKMKNDFPPTRPMNLDAFGQLS